MVIFLVKDALPVWGVVQVRRGKNAGDVEFGGGLALKLERKITENRDEGT